MAVIRFHLSISKDELLRFYRGSVRYVIAEDGGGKRVQFPAEALRPYVTQVGVHGMFELEYDEQAGKLLNIRKLGDGAAD